MRVEVGGGVRLFVDVEGSALVPDGPRMLQRPVVVALHGGPGADHSTLRPALSPLAEVAQVVYVDHRGHGRSDDGPPESWTLPQLADDVHDLCVALGIARPVVYGQSFGAVVAMVYAARHPEQPRGLMLVAASAVGYALSVDRVAEQFRHLGGDVAADVYRRDAAENSAETHELWMRHCLPHMSARREPAGDDWVARIVQRPYEVHRRLNQQTGDMDLRADLSRIRCPVLLMAGEADPMTPPEDSQEIAAALGGPPTVVRIPGAAHTVLRDQPEAAHQALRDFLRSLPGD